MYWRICLDSIPGHFAPPQQPRVPPPAGLRGRSAKYSFMNPLRLAFAPASPLAGEEGDQSPEGFLHA